MLLNAEKEGLIGPDTIISRAYQAAIQGIGLALVGAVKATRY
jgi:hypothetical protein